MSTKEIIMSRIREIIYTAAGTLMMLVRNGELPQATKKDVLEAIDEAAEEAPYVPVADWEPPVAPEDWRPTFTPDEPAEPASEEVPL